MKKRRRSEIIPAPPSGGKSTNSDPKVADGSLGGAWKRNLGVSLAVFAAVFVVLSTCSSFLPACWDEGVTAQRASVASIWKHRLMARLPVLNALVSELPGLDSFRENDTLGVLLSRQELDRFWMGVRTHEGHPVFPIMLMSLGIRYDSFPPDLWSLRFYSVLFFSFSLAVVFYRMSVDFGRPAAVFGVLSILLLPRVFAHAQFATWDSPMMASWLLAWALFPRALKGGWGAILYGACIGMTIASKFTGIGVVLAPLFWLAIRLVADRFAAPQRRLEVSWQKLLLRAGLTIVGAVSVFILLNPPLWNDPIGGIAKFLSLNMSRKLEVYTQFFGQRYSLNAPLPWYNTLVWTAITVPVGILLLFFIGLGKAVQDRGRDRFWDGLFLFLNFLTLIVVRAIPGTPVHDGVRLFVAAFPFLGLIAGIGAAALWTPTERPGIPRLVSGRVLVCLIFLASLYNMFLYAPQWLSFYNAAIGGPAGAAKLGMEPTYYWDAYDAEVVDWLVRHTAPGDVILYGNNSPQTIAFFYQKMLPGRELCNYYYGNEGVVKRGRYYVQQLRHGDLNAFDMEVKETGKPVFVKNLPQGGRGFWDLGDVPLIIIYELPHE